MYKLVLTEIVIDAAADKAWRAKQDKRRQELGLEPLKVYRVLGREGGMVFVEFPAYASWEELGQREGQADAEIQKLVRERYEGKMLLLGTTQWYLLTDY